MKKIITTIIVAALFAPAVGMAVTAVPGARQISGAGSDPIVNILNTVGNWMFSILLAVAAIYILIAAFDYLFAKGDSTKVGKAHQAIIYSLVAIVVAALTKGLIEVAKSIAEGSGLI